MGKITIPTPSSPLNPVPSIPTQKVGKMLTDRIKIACLFFQMRPIEFYYEKNKLLELYY